MPTITINREDFLSLLGKQAPARAEFSDAWLESRLPLVKGEIKDRDAERLHVSPGGTDLAQVLRQDALVER